jgi:hypothetical protein
MHFNILGDVTTIEVIAKGRAIHDLKRLIKKYGKGKWRKMKGNASVQLANDEVRYAEIHWYEAHGIGKRKFKIKRFLD